MGKKGPFCTLNHLYLRQNTPPLGDELVSSEVPDQATGDRFDSVVTTLFVTRAPVQFPLRSNTLACDCTRTDLWHHHQIKALSGCRCFLRAKQTGLWHSQQVGIKQLPGTNCAALIQTSCDTYSQLACWANGYDEGWAFNTGFQRGVWTSVFVVLCLYWANQQGFHTSSDPKNFSWPIMG